MLDFKIKRDPTTGEQYLETSLNGKPLLTTPQLNKGTAFTQDERRAFGLMGKLPVKVETLDEQVERTYIQYSAYHDKLKKNIFLNELHDRNQVLFYKLVSKYIEEMMPMIYTPIVGRAVKKFSREFRQPRGLYIAYPDMNDIETILDNRSNPEIDLIVVTDGEGVLGIGDQGVGGIDIPVAKLMVYSLCGGLDPTRTLPILLDVGTNNPTLLNDPMYLGWRQPRLQGAVYDEFVDRFVTAIQHKFPNVFLHWEDFGRANAQRYLDRFSDRICTFNDDIQGTGIVALSALIAAAKANHSDITQQRIVIFGAGTAGAGIAQQIYRGMLSAGLSEEEARQRFWLLDRDGLLHDAVRDLTQAQKPFARSAQELVSHGLQLGRPISLEEVVHIARPTVLIGCSACGGAFTETIVKQMAQYTPRPIIFPLSNPTEYAEAKPIDLFNWTNGRVLVATGSPFANVDWENHSVRIAQCNNAFAFPGIGVGIIAVKAKQLSEGMLWAACQALSEQSPVLHDNTAPLLPSLSEAKNVAKYIAIAVAEQAKAEGLATTNLDRDIHAVIEELIWEPKYLPYRYKAK